MKTWAYGITTIPLRIESHLPATIASLARAGFDQPRLFVDACENPSLYEKFNLPVTRRWPKIRLMGNWLLALWELYIREPMANYYALFQDDLVACKNLKQYLDSVRWPENSYLNLYTFPDILRQAHGTKGWFKTCQMGKGAVALAFQHENVMELLTSRFITARLQESVRGWRSIDGAVSTAMHLIGWKEYAHNPSLVQHTGVESTFDKRVHQTQDSGFPIHKWPKDMFADSFPGEEYDALAFLSKE